MPAAILFDLNNGGDKRWGELPLYRELGRRACAAAAEDFALGNAGAGLGAAAGALKGGLGSASLVGDGWTVGALAAVNSLGAVTMADGPVFWAWPFEQAGEFGAVPPALAPSPLPLAVELKGTLGANTTLVVVATDAALSKTQAARLAVMAQDGIARAIRPAHTPLDGDTVFALATGRQPHTPPPIDLARLGALAADCVARAIARGVYEAQDLGALQSYRSVHAPAGLPGA